MRLQRFGTVARAAAAVISIAFSAVAAAQMSAALRGGGRATAEQWRAARPVLRAAMGCNKPLAPTDDLRAVFRGSNNNYDGEHKLPTPLGVYGYPTTQITIVEGWRNEAVSYSVDLEAPIAAVVRAARLVPEPGLPRRYGRRTAGGGHLVASELESHDVRLTCSWPPPGEPR